MRNKLFLALVAVVAFSAPAAADIIVTSYDGPFDNGGFSGPEGPISGDQYFIAAGIGGAGGFAISQIGTVLSTIDNGSEVIATTIVEGAPVISSDTLIDNGGGNFTLILALSSTGQLAPGGFSVGGQPATTAGLFIGTSAGSDPVNFTDHSVVFANVELRDAAGATLGGPFDITAFPQFTLGPGGGWNGSLGVTFGAGSTGVGISEYILTVNFNKQVIPEPASFALLSIVGLGLLVRRRR